MVNKRNERYDVYIGRGSKWGNPFSHKPSKFADIITVATREEAVYEYYKYIIKRPDLIAALHQLKGKKLGCYCAPALCHGHILAHMINPYVGQKPFSAAAAAIADPLVNRAMNRLLNSTGAKKRHGPPKIAAQFKTVPDYGIELQGMNREIEGEVRDTDPKRKYNFWKYDRIHFKTVRVQYRKYQVLVNSDYYMITNPEVTVIAICPTNIILNSPLVERTAENYGEPELAYEPPREAWTYFDIRYCNDGIKRWGLPTELRDYLLKGKK